VNCFVLTLNVISEQQIALYYRRECIEQRIMLFNSRFFVRAPCTSVLLSEGKSRALIYLHVFRFLYLATVNASYLTFKEVFLTLKNYLHFKYETLSCTKCERVSHIWLPVSRINKPLSYNVVNYYPAIINFTVNNAFILKALFSIWFRCWLTESEITGIRRLSFVP
jgi:hypothetical protein